jgi:endonuclease I
MHRAQVSKRQMQDTTSEPLFSGCNLEEYYTPLLSATPSGNPLLSTRTAIHDLLQDTHRRVLPYTASSSNTDDVWMALMDLDAGAPIVIDGSSISTVNLIYANVNVSAVDHGTADTWNREHLWPKSLGVGDGGPDFSDIHHLRPADWNVNAARSNLYFGTCGLVKDAVENCRQPATAEAASDTAMDGRIFLPPAHRRGDIARALFYMDLRYNGSDGGLDLELTDCPNSSSSSSSSATTHQMAYLSQLLEWHKLDPVNDEERTRNDKACGRWQGNRNIFVDYPELVQAIFGDPQPFPTDAQGYASCQNNNNGESRTPGPTSMPSITNGGPSSSSSSSSNWPTKAPSPSVVGGPSAPTNEGIDNSCSDLNAGDVGVIAFDSDDPDMVALVALEDLPPGLVLYMTDNAWTGSGFLTNEGTVEVRPGYSFFIPRRCWFAAT